MAVIPRLITHAIGHPNCRHGRQALSGESALFGLERFPLDD